MRVVFGLKLTNSLQPARSPLDLPRLAVVERGLLKRKIKRRLRLLDRGTRLQSSHYPEPPITGAHELRTITIYLRLPPHRNRHVHRRPEVHCAFKAGWRYAGDRKSHIIEIDLFADDVGPAAKALLPVSITDHGHRTSCRVVIRISNHAAHKSWDTQNVVIISCYRLSIDVV